MLSNVRKQAKEGARRLSNLDPYAHISVKGAKYSIHDLRALDEAYRKMHDGHASLHAGLIGEIQGKGFRSVLEVACGTGWNVPAFRAAALEYYGLDISETAIAALALKFPENRYFNLSICDCAMFGEGFFDLVYSSSMLEHIGYHQEAIKEMIRLAKREVYLIFFEGLIEGDQDRIQFHPYSDVELDGRQKDLFGRKIVLQDHLNEKRKGWYWNRYSRNRLTEFLNGYDFAVEDKNNRPFIDGETVIVIHKSS